MASVLDLNSRSAFLLLSECGFLVATNWKQLAGYLGLGLDERNRLETSALISHDFNTTLEEALDHWLRSDPNPTWLDLIKGVEPLEHVTANKMRQKLNINEQPSHDTRLNDARQVEKAAAIIQCHINELCVAIKNPVPIACQLFERNVIDNSYYQAVISSRSLHFRDMSVKTMQLLNTIYQTAIDKCRVDVVRVFIAVLGEIEVIKPLAHSMQTQLDQVMLSTSYAVITDEHHSHDVVMNSLEHQTSTITTSSNDDNEDCVDVVLSPHAKQKFRRMQMRFGGIMLRLCNSLTSKPVSVQDLKDQLIFSFCDLEDDIEPCTSVNDVMKVLRRSSYCSFSNCFIVQDLAQLYSLQDVEEDLREYLIERSEYYRTIMLEDFVQEAQESIGRNRKVVFRLDWNKGEKSLAEFEQMLQDVFEGAAKFIRLKQVEDGSVIMICECPEFVVGSLKILIKEREDVLLTYNVLLVTIGDNVVMKRKPKIYDSTEDLLLSRQGSQDLEREDNGEKSRMGKRSRTSSEMRDIDLLPDELLPPIKSLSDSVPPVPPRTYRKLSLPPERPPKPPYLSIRVPLPFSDPSTKPALYPYRSARSRHHSHSGGVRFHYSHSTPAQATLPFRYHRSKSDAASTRPPYPLPERAVSLDDTIEGVVTTHPNPQRELLNRSPPQCDGISKTTISADSNISNSDVNTATVLSPPQCDSLDIGIDNNIRTISDHSTDSGISNSDINTDNSTSVTTIADHSPPQSESLDDVSITGSTYEVATTDDEPLRQYEWYWGLISREFTHKILSNTTDGAFLVRKTEVHSRHKYIITFRHNGNTKNIGIRLVKDKYDIRGGVAFESVGELVEHYQQHPLPIATAEAIKLEFSEGKFTETIDGDIENVLDIKQWLKRLQDVSNTFDDKNAEYQRKLAQKIETKQKLQRLHSAASGYKNTSSLLKQSLVELERNYSVMNNDIQSLNTMSACFKSIQTKIEDAEKQLAGNIGTQFTTQNHYRALEMFCNLLRAELTSLSREQDFLMSQLINEGLTVEEVYEMVKTNSFSDSEDTYMTFYKKQFDVKESMPSDVYEYVFLGSTIHKGIIHHERQKQEYAYPIWGFTGKGKREPLYDTVDDSKTPSITPHPPPPLSVSTIALPGKEKLIVGWKPSMWYFEIDEKMADKMLANKKDGTFLCRPAKRELLKEGGIHLYTLHVVNKKSVVQLKVIRQNDFFGFSTPCIFNSLYDLIVHHSNTSLHVYDPQLNATLSYPVKNQ